MKRLLFLVLACGLLLPLKAYKEHEVYQNYGFNFAYNAGNDDDLIDYNSSLEFDFGLLYSFNKYVQFGGGFGLNSIYTKTLKAIPTDKTEKFNTVLLPMYLRGQANLYQNDFVVPFLVLDFGYDFMLWEEGSNSNYYAFYNESYYKGGFTFTPHIALDLPSTSDLHFMINLGYRMHFINASEDYNINSFYVGFSTSF